MKLLKQLVLVCLPLLILSARAATYLSPCDVDLSKSGKTIYVTAHTGKQILTFDVQARRITNSVDLPAEPTGLVQSRDEKEFYVSGGGHDGRIWVLSEGKVIREIKTGHTPMQPLLSPDEQTVYVCNRFNNDVSIIDTESGETRSRVRVLREPVAADLTPDGKYLYVANHLPDGAADADYVAAKISVIDTTTLDVKTIRLVNGAEGLRGLKISPDGKYALATHLMARYQVPTTQLERGWVSTDALSVIRVEDQSLQYTVLLDDITQGFPNPWAIDFSADGKTLFVSSAGLHEISMIDFPAMLQKIEAEASSTSAETHLYAHNNLSLLTGIRKRIGLSGVGPRALVVSGELVYIANYYSDTLEVLRIFNDGKIGKGSFPMGSQQPLTPERQGEIYFNDARLCFQNWLSCATCHPDARTDGMNWDLLNDGIGNPKNAKSMLLAHETPPAMWLGVRENAEAGVRAGLRHIQFSTRPEEDAQAIDAYLRSLKPVPSPYLVNGELSEAALRGKGLFEGMSCASCHPALLYTNLKLYEVGTTRGQDKGKPVDVPSLIETWHTAPYLHDGRAATIHDLLKSQDHADILKEMKMLTEPEINDLAEYILSL